MAWATAVRAMLILLPSMEPERSSTRATSAGARGAATDAGAGGALMTTWR